MDKIEKIRKAAIIVDKNGKPKTKLKKTRKMHKPHQTEKLQLAKTVKNKTKQIGQNCKTEYPNDKLDELGE